MENKWMVLHKKERKIRIYLGLKYKIGKVVICGSLFLELL